MKQFAYDGSPPSNCHHVLNALIRWRWCTDRWMSPQVPAPAWLWLGWLLQNISVTRRDRMCCFSSTTFSASPRLDQRSVNGFLIWSVANLNLNCALPDGILLMFCRCLPCWVVSPLLWVISQLWPLTWVPCRRELQQQRRAQSHLCRYTSLTSMA